MDVPTKMGAEVSESVKVKTVIQYAVQAPNGKWVTDARPESMGALVIYQEKAYVASTFENAQRVRDRYTERLREAGGTGRFRVLKREVTVLQPQYVPVEVEVEVEEEQE